MDICAYLLSGESFDSGTWRQVRKLQLIYNRALKGIDQGI